jgi:hypothetical protein
MLQPQNPTADADAGKARNQAHAKRSATQDTEESLHARISTAVF